MEAWIRSVTTWAHRTRMLVLSYDAPIFSSGTDTGTVTVAGETRDYTGDWLILAGRPYLIKSAAPSKGSTKLTVQLPEEVFSRQLRYAGDGAEAFGTFLAAQITAEYISQADELYAMPYLTVSNSDTTGFIFPVEPGELFTLTDVIRLAAAAGVFLSWSPSFDGLEISISNRASAEHRVNFDDGHTQLKSQTYTTAIVAKATVRRVHTEADVTTVLETGVYYWQADGTVSTSPPSPRIRGSWVQTDVKEDLTLEDGALAAMAKNSSAYKVEFWSDRELLQGDKLTMRIGALVSSGVVSCARISSSDRRTMYRSGTAAVTLTDKIKEKQP